MIDSLRRVLEYAIGYLEIIPGSAKDDPDIATVSQMLVAYDALAPKPDAWPDGARWYTIDAENQCYWHIDEPIYDGEWWSNTAEFSGFTDVPLGLDWRLCKWQYPEVAP